MLTGTEVKSLREGKAQLKDAYAAVRDGEVWLIGLYIAALRPPRATTTTPSARASCCCTASEIERLIGRTQERGLTLVPTRIYFSGARSRAKVEIALARGKDVYDKRETIRTREMAREVQRELRERGAGRGRRRITRRGWRFAYVHLLHPLRAFSINCVRRSCACRWVASMPTTSSAIRLR